MKKKTDDLINELVEAEDIREFLADNEDSLETLSLSKYFKELFEKYNVSKSQVLQRAKMTENNYGYEVLRGSIEKPARDRLIRLCFGFPLTIEEATKLLQCGRVRPFYPRDKRDVFIMYALKNRYTMD